jgi:hypothetical protein
MEDRESIKSKIAKLLNMTSENGASENEALIATQMAAKLMAEHDINTSEILIKNSKSIKGTNQFRQYGKTKLGQLFSVPVANFCDCKVWTCGDQIIYFGLPNDVEIEISKFKKSSEYAIASQSTNGKTLVSSFICGIEQRISAKLRELTIRKKASVNAATGTSLVILKDAVVKADFDALGMSLRKNTSQRTVRSNSAYNAGNAAGNNVNIVSGITGSKQGQIA